MQNLLFVIVSGEGDGGGLTNISHQSHKHPQEIENCFTFIFKSWKNMIDMYASVILSTKRNTTSVKNHA